MSEIDTIRERAAKYHPFYTCSSKDGRTEIWSDEATEDIETLLTLTDTLQQQLVAALEQNAALQAEYERLKAALEMSIEQFRKQIEADYRSHPTGCGGSFGEILCWEIHSNGQTFLWLADKWGIDVEFLGRVIADHCQRLKPAFAGGGDEE